MKQNKLIVGKFAAPFGVRGWIKLHSYTQPLDELSNHKLWYVQHQGVWKALKITDSKPHGEYLIAKIDGIDDRDEVRIYTNCLISLDRDALPKLPEGEYYWEDLIGLTVIDQSGKNLGTVTQMLATGSNDVMQVELDGKRRLFPYTSQAVIKVDLENKTIMVDWEF